MLAEITMGRVSGTRDPIPEGFWIPTHLKMLLQIWEEDNKLGRDYYNKVTLPHIQGG